MIRNRNRKFVLAARPQGMPGESDFRLEEEPVPEPGEGEVLVRGIYLSLDPYMRGRMSAGPSYAANVALGEVMVGGVVGEVVRSNNAGFAAGDIVEGTLGWQDFAVSDGKGLRKVDPALAPISTANGVLGMPGLTAYFALLDIGQPEPGETVVISSAAGAVGAVAGQIAKIKGCRAVGIAGSDAKVDHIVNELGFDAGINYKSTADLDAAIAGACPDGVDVYYDNVGGAISFAVFNHLALRARIVICGQISQYNLEKPELGPRNLRFMLVNRARMQGFLIFDHVDRFQEGLEQLAEWVRSGQVKYREDIVEGFENAPRAFLKLFTGESFGKLLVKIGDEPG